MKAFVLYCRVQIAPQPHLEDQVMFFTNRGTSCLIDYEVHLLIMKGADRYTRDSNSILLAVLCWWQPGACCTVRIRLHALGGTSSTISGRLPTSSGRLYGTLSCSSPLPSCAPGLAPEIEESHVWYVPVMAVGGYPLCSSGSECADLPFRRDCCLLRYTTLTVCMTSIRYLICIGCGELCCWSRQTAANALVDTLSPR
jgi:hypothetical protein